MRLKTTAKAALSIALSGLLMTSTPLSALAATSENNTNASETTIEVDNSNISVNEAQDTRTVTLVESDGTASIFTYNKETNTVYSSITGETVSVDGVSDIDAPSTRSAGQLPYTRSYATYYLSYAKIKSLTGRVATYANVAAAVLACTGAQSLGAAASFISAAAGLINSSVSPSSKHGLKMTVCTTRHYRTRLGKRYVYNITKTISSAGKY